MNNINFNNAEIYFSQTIILNLGIAFFLGLLISFVYRRTHKGLSYSQSFILTNVLITIIVSMVIMIIGNNLARAFALVGALSIIRFRTVVKDTKDIAFIFWSLAAGMAAGTSSYFLAIYGSLFIALVSFILFYINYGSLYKSEFILQFRIQIKTEGSDQDHINLINKFCRTSTILSSEPSPDSKSIKVTYDIILINEKEHDNFITELSKLDYISEIALVTSKNDLDY